MQSVDTTVTASSRLFWLFFAATRYLLQCSSATGLWNMGYVPFCWEKYPSSQRVFHPWDGNDVSNKTLFTECPHVLKKHCPCLRSLFILLLWQRGLLWAFHDVFWFPLIPPCPDRPGDEAVAHSWWNSLLCLTDACLLRPVDQPNVRVQPWRM